MKVGQVYLPGETLPVKVRRVGNVNNAVLCIRRARNVVKKEYFISTCYLAACDFFNVGGNTTRIQDAHHEMSNFQRLSPVFCLFVLVDNLAGDWFIIDYLLLLSIRLCASARSLCVTPSQE